MPDPTVEKVTEQTFGPLKVLWRRPPPTHSRAASKKNNTKNNIRYSSIYSSY